MSRGSFGSRERSSGDESRERSSSDESSGRGALRRGHW